jgi:protein-S-isoprenylcysteine O-methyltransferase Ste14
MSAPDKKPKKKDAAAIRILPPAVPLLCVLAGLALSKLMPLGWEVMLPPPHSYWVGGLIIVAAVYFLGFRAVKLMRGSGQSENPYTKTTEILETGPYRFTRNPMYLMMVVLCIGFAVLLSNIWILLLTPVCALALHFLVILPEEAYLETKFGATYLAFKSRVRRWI